MTFDCQICGHDKIDSFEVDQVKDGTVYAMWACASCGTHHWGDFSLDESTVGHDPTSAEAPETYWTHPSLTASERNPSMTGRRT